MTFVYTDSSSAILLERSGLFDQLLAHANVVMPESVYSEITKPGYSGEERFKTHYQNKLFKVSPYIYSGTQTPLTKENSDLNRWGKGERDTVGLYLKNRDGYVLIDDGKAARWCFKHGIPFINALLVPKLFWYSGLISENDYLSKTDTLCAIGRYSNKIKTFAKDCTMEDLSYFIEKTLKTKPFKD